MRPEEPPSLRLLQERFYAACTSWTVDVPDGEWLEGHHLDGTGVDDDRATGATRLRVYARMFLWRITDVLAEGIPKLRELLGAHAFRALAADYVRACPPAHPSLRNAGRRLPDFLRGHAVCKAAPWLADLARLEWAHDDLFDGPDAPPLTLSQLRARGADEYASLALRLVPCHRIVDASFAVDELWQRLEEGSPVAAPRPAQLTLLVWRRELAVQHRTVDAAEAAALRFVQRGATLADLCDELSQGGSLDDTSRLVFALLSRWIDEDLIASGP